MPPAAGSPSTASSSLQAMVPPETVRSPLSLVINYSTALLCTQIPLVCCSCRRTARCWHHAYASILWAAFRRPGQRNGIGSLGWRRSHQVSQQRSATNPGRMPQVHSRRACDCCQLAKHACRAAGAAAPCTFAHNLPSAQLVYTFAQAILATCCLICLPAAPCAGCPARPSLPSSARQAAE